MLIRKYANQRHYLHISIIRIHSHICIMLYEIFYLVGASKETDLDSIKKEVEKIITDSEGKFLEKETVEKRRLSYIVNKETHGIYIARRFELEDTDKIGKITSKLNLNQNVDRFIISRADELPELKSKEERIAEVAKKEEQQKNKAVESAEKAPAKKVEKETKSAPVKTPKAKKSETEKKEEIIKDDDIDKKLEEILNI